MSNAEYIIGIDLGTTNCTLSYIPVTSLKENDSPEAILFDIPQIVNSGEFDRSLALPSSLYFPLEEETKNKKCIVPWDIKKPFIVGLFAKERGAEVPNRLIHSAKSWLCHTGIDRREKLLPMDSEENHKMSPLEACSETLKYLKESWDFTMPKAPLVNQTVLITVPASFDPSARQLVQEAAKNAGFPEIILLEEPQAAFYAWIYSQPNRWRKELKVGDIVLVVDIGGGTTDFSLIQVEEENGNLQLRRHAVGSHLLLGGDNIDLALAYFAKEKLENSGHSIDNWQLQTLVHQCRNAKEKLLNDENLKSVDLTVLGRGSKLIGNTLKTELTKDEINEFVLKGFIPFVEPQERSKTEQRSGFQQIGLPYAQDPRISCQLAKFLSMTGEADTKNMDHFVLPSGVLFNGGTLKAAALRNQLLNLLNQWADQLNKPKVKELTGADYDYAVSRGAAYYGFARQGKGVRIRAGTSSSYFIGVEDAVPAVPGISPPLRAVCVVPFGLEEGEERILENQEFALILGELATFRFFSHSAPSLSTGEEPVVGTVIRNWKHELRELHPIESILDKKEGEGKTVRIKVKSKVTELGVLEIWCEANDGRKWKLEFDLRR